MSIVEILKSVPRSYEDFVLYASECMEKDDGVKNSVLNLINEHPESDSSDILKVILDCHGSNEPLEIIDDEDDEADTQYAVSGLRAAL